MEIKDNILKEYLKNVYFVSGTACGGKTTVTRMLSEKYNIPVYDNDDEFDRHQKIADPENQPNMCMQFRDADEFFGRTAEEYRSWLLGNLDEQLDFMILDLIEMSGDRKIICDCNITLEQARRLTDPSRVVFLIREPGNIVDEYCNREDHKPFRDWIHSASDYETAKAVCQEALGSLNGELYEEVKKSEFVWIDRADGLSREATAKQVESLFGYFGTKINVLRVEKDTDLAANLFEYVENCSWTEVRDHIAGMIRSWEFSDWETMFAAVLDGKIIGFCAALKTDYYPLPEITPWITCVFVDEKHRGKKYALFLVRMAESYLRYHGFERCYIASPSEGLYERYGYTYVKDIVNYGGDTDRLYTKELH